MLVIFLLLEYATVTAFFNFCKEYAVLIARGVALWWGLVLGAIWKVKLKTHAENRAWGILRVILIGGDSGGMQV